MKRHFTLSLLLSISFCLPVPAQTLHTILFADTIDVKIGSRAKASVNHYSNVFLSAIRASIKDTYDISTPIEKIGYDCSKKNLLNTLSNLSCNDKDIVIFIYVGHGKGYSKSDSSKFPQMCFAPQYGSGERNPDDFYPLEKVRDAIMSNNPRLCLVIGDCCNFHSDYSIEPFISLSPDSICSQGKGVLEKLFLSKKGSVILTAAKKGQYAWAGNSGMVLEHCFSDVIKNIKDGKATYNSWEDFLSDVRKSTVQYSKKCNLTIRDIKYEQTPDYENETTDAPIIDNPKPITTKSNGLQEALMQVIDSRYSDTERIKTALDLQSQYFEGDNVDVEIVGIDGTTIVGSMSIQAYLRHAATENDLADIAILDKQLNNHNKLTYLKVHELYKDY